MIGKCHSDESLPIVERYAVENWNFMAVMIRKASLGQTDGAHRPRRFWRRARGPPRLPNPFLTIGIICRSSLRLSLRVLHTSLWAENAPTFLHNPKADTHVGLRRRVTKSHGVKRVKCQCGSIHIVQPKSSSEPQCQRTHEKAPIFPQYTSRHSLLQKLS